MNLAVFRETPRGKQVLTDVSRRKPRMWIAIDDNAEGWPAHALQHVVLTHRRQSISDADVLKHLKEKLELVASKP
jgi:hypothetical protein